MKFMMLWSDVCVYALLLFAFLACIKRRPARDKERAWIKVFCRPLNFISVIILGCYILVGILDTIHFYEKNNSNKINPSGIVSVLDILLSPMAMHDESTYSAPFAIYSFSKEVTVENGIAKRSYPRLAYGGRYLQDPNNKTKDILEKLFFITLSAGLAWTSITAIILGGCRRYYSKITDILKGNEIFPWRTLVVSLGMIIFIVFFIAGFMPYYHILGTNQVGQDVLYQSLKSIRTGLLIGTLTTLLTFPFAILFGIMAGYFRGWWDDVIQYTYTTLSAIPSVLLIAATVLMLEIVMDRHSNWFQTVIHRADLRLLALCAILGITSWTGLCRLLRGETLKISQMDYIQAARSLGSSHQCILFKHILPNVMHIIFITLVLDFSGLVLAEAVLSYVGVGVDPSSNSWGIMINSARMEMARDPLVWWNLSAAFIFMFILVLSANIFSDAVQESLDPSLVLRRLK